MMTLDLSPHARATHWSAGYIGRPWSEAFTCWHMVREVQERFYGRRLPDFDPGSQSPEGELQRAIAASAWRPVPVLDAHDGDVLMLRGTDGPHIATIVVVEGRPSVLHMIGGRNDDGSTWGSVRRDTMEALGQLGYGRLRLWRPA